MELLGLFTKEEPRMLMFEKVVDKISVIPAFKTNDAALQYLNAKVNEEYREFYIIDFISLTDYEIANRKFTVHMVGHELFIKIVA